MGKRKPKANKKGMAKSNIEDVEEALEDERLISKMKSNKGGKKKGADDIDLDDLFTIDTKGSSEGLSRSSRREIARAKLFPKKGPNIGLTSTEEAKIVRAERQLEAAQRPKKPKGPEVYDLWAAPLNPHAAKNPALLQKKHLYVSKPGTTNKKEGRAPAVLPAHEGQSMNPHREAYEDLACAAAAAQLEREHEDEEIYRRMRPVTAALKDLVGPEKLAQLDEDEKLNLFRSLQMKSAGTAEAEGAGPGLKGATKWKQKAQALRNKRKRQQVADAIVDQAKDQRRLEKEVGEVNNILKEMEEADELRKTRKQYREAMRAKRRQLEETQGVVPKKRKLGGGKYAEEAAILPELEAGARGLRAMPLRTSAIRDRIASITRRGLLPPPSEASKEKVSWYKKKKNKLKRTRKHCSPLMKDNLLLR